VRKTDTEITAKKLQEIYVYLSVNAYEAESKDEEVGKRCPAGGLEQKKPG
jgi:hypothetical protein